MKLFNSFLSLSISFTLLMGCQEDLLPTISEINDDHLKPSVVGLDDEDYYSLTSEFNSYSSGRIAGNLNFEDALKTFDESGDAKYSVEIPNDDILLTQNLILW